MKIAFVTLFRYFCQGGKTSGSAIKKEEKSFKGGESEGGRGDRNWKQAFDRSGCLMERRCFCESAKWEENFMGIYVNPRNVAFRKALNGDIYIGETRGGLWGDGKMVRRVSSWRTLDL